MLGRQPLRKRFGGSAGSRHCSGWRQCPGVREEVVVVVVVGGGGGGGGGDAKVLVLMWYWCWCCAKLALRKEAGEGRWELNR
jgi:hypothetical protein